MEKTLKTKGDNVLNIFGLYGAPIHLWRKKLIPKNRSYANILNEIVSDINSSSFLAFCGQYRIAMQCLRSCLELCLNFIFYFDHPVEFQWWQEGKYELKFKRLVDYLSRLNNYEIFRREYSFDEKLLIKYNILSKFIHGSQLEEIRKEGLYSEVRFDEGCFNRWLENFKEISLYCNLLFILKFPKLFSRFTKDERKIILAPVSLDVVAHLRKIGQDFSVF